MTKPQTIFDSEGNPLFAIVPWQTFELISSVLSDTNLGDEEIYDIAKQSNEESFPIDVVDRLLAGESAVRVYRTHRGITQKELARKTGVNAVYISQIETGKRTGSAKTLAKIAKALEIDVDELI